MSTSIDGDWESRIPVDLPPASKDAVPTSKSEQPPQRSQLNTHHLEQEEVEDRKHTREMRGVYADKAYKLAKYALSGWAAFLLVAGVSNACNGYPMFSDKVVIAVTTGVTVSVLAAFLGVIRGIFPSMRDKIGS